MHLTNTTSNPPQPRETVLRALKGSGRTLELNTTGLSMEPLIRENSTVTVSFAPPEDVLEGDVILFIRDGRLVLHRVLDIAHAGGSIQFSEKGDHQPFSSTIPDGDYLGYVALIQTGGHRVRPRTPRGRASARRVLAWSRMERRLYRMKVSLLGDRPQVLGKAWISIGRIARKLLHRPGTADHE